MLYNFCVTGQLNTRSQFKQSSRSRKTFPFPGFFSDTKIDF